MILAHEFIQIIPPTVKHIELVSERVTASGHGIVEFERWHRDEIRQLISVLKFSEKPIYVRMFDM